VGGSLTFGPPPSPKPCYHHLLIALLVNARQWQDRNFRSIKKKLNRIGCNGSEGEASARGEVRTPQWAEIRGAGDHLIFKQDAPSGFVDGVKWRRSNGCQENNHRRGEGVRAASGGDLMCGSAACAKGMDPRFHILTLTSEKN